MAIQLQETPNGMGLVEIADTPQMSPDEEMMMMEQMEAEQQAQQAPPMPMPPHPAKGKYGPIINYVFGEKIEEYMPEPLAPIIQAITQEMRGKSGFVQLGNQMFYKNGSMIELVENPMAVPEEARVLNLDKQG